MIVDQNVDISLLDNNLNLNVDSRTFKTLIDGIYIDKLASVIREIGVNAKDSHILAGNKEPYKIALMQDEELSIHTIYVKDEGVGLSKEEAEKYLCTLNSSSKRDTNTQTGFFGIGCKAPFAVAAEFEYVCVKDGKKTSVLFLRLDGSIPQYEIKDLGKTDEPNGVTCRVLLDPSYRLRLDDFLIAINRYLILFPVKPEVSVYNHENRATLFELDPVREFEDFFLVHYSHSSNSTDTLVAIEGSVLSLQNLNNEGFYYKPPRNTEWAFVPKVPYGTLTFNEGREVIEQTPSNREALKVFYNSKIDSWLQPQNLSRSVTIDFAVIGWVPSWLRRLPSRDTFKKAIYFAMTREVSLHDVHTPAEFVNIFRSFHWRSDIHSSPGVDMKEAHYIWCNTAIKWLSSVESQRLKESLPPNTILVLTTGGKQLYEEFLQLDPNFSVKFYNMKELRKDYPEIAQAYSPNTTSSSSNSSVVEADPLDRVKFDFTAHVVRKDDSNTLEKNCTYKQFAKDLRSLNSYSLNLYFVSENLCSSDDVREEIINLFKKKSFIQVLFFEYELKDVYKHLPQRKFELEAVNSYEVEHFIELLKESEESYKLFNTSILKSYLKFIRDGGEHFPSGLFGIEVNRSYDYPLETQSTLRTHNLYSIAEILSPVLPDDLDGVFKALPKEHEGILNMDVVLELFKEDNTDDN